MSDLDTAPATLPLPPHLCMAVLGNRDILSTVIRAGSVDLPSISCLARTCKRLRTACKEESVHYRAMVASERIDKENDRWVFVTEAIKGSPSDDALTYVLSHACTRGKIPLKGFMALLLSVVLADPSRSYMVSEFVKENVSRTDVITRVVEQFFGFAADPFTLPETHDSGLFTRAFYFEFLTKVLYLFIVGPSVDVSLTVAFLRVIDGFHPLNVSDRHMELAMHVSRWDIVELIIKNSPSINLLGPALRSGNIEAMRRYLPADNTTFADMVETSNWNASEANLTFFIERYGEDNLAVHGEYLYTEEQHHPVWRYRWKEAYCKAWSLSPAEAGRYLVGAARSSEKVDVPFRDRDCFEILCRLAFKCFLLRERVDPEAVPAGCYSYRISGDDRIYFHKLVGRGDDSQNPHFMDGSGHPRYFKLHVIQAIEESLAKKQKK